MSTILTAVIKRIPVAPMFLYRLAIGNRAPLLSGNSKVRIQLYQAGKKVAPITTRTVGGVLMTHTGYNDWEFEAPLLGPMWDMSEAYETAAPGEDTWFGIDESGQAVKQTTVDRVNTWKNLRLLEGKQSIFRRIEWMLAQQLTLGTITLTGRNYSATIDLGFSNTVDSLTAWDDAIGDPIADLKTLRDEAASAGVPIPNVLVLSTDAAAAFVENANVKTRLQNANVGYTDPIFGITPLKDEAAYRIGYIAELDVMVYAYGATYTDDDGSSASFIPSGRGVFFPSAERNEATISYGAIRDARENRWYSTDIYVREFASIDGHSEWLEINSRPVACLNEVASWYSLENLVTSPSS